ncbi:hypothetical protein EXIGLDRAFT_494540 [Exidia glandulosa HHB12029]|uniref:Uncharacterized protein n=1 Tax=Exidia glandulosa HHB12029 TaxID=1314781 RepID=A0A165JK29_EXIGL|nr:hypothetical protein EXIGLDRAFT_494540 [Exidia glandulosa HHB12029]
MIHRECGATPTYSIYLIQRAQTVAQVVHSAIRVACHDMSAEGFRRTPPSPVVPPCYGALRAPYFIGGPETDPGVGNIVFPPHKRAERMSLALVWAVRPDSC